ncbi:MAG TPA: MmgE/PrpD family protein [Gemmatimonadaceae bacterium]|jgi:2-methylcitrate dehydratase PrpD
MPASAEQVSRRLAEVMASTRYADLPPAVIDDAKRSILDWLGSCLAGSLEKPARIAQQIVAGLGVSDEATVFSAGRSSAAGAALANGVASHILELDDVHKGSTLHAAAPIIPAALAVAERERKSGKDFILAVVLGYDAALRVGEAVNPDHYKFWHPTGTAATFGAAVAAGSLIGLDEKQMLDALGTAGTQAAGLWEFNADGAMSKTLHPGKAAMNGVLAADLAKAGFTGASKILEGDRGFFRATAAHFDPSRITDQLGSHWKISENCFKLHSCCGHTHSAVDVMLELRDQIDGRSGAFPERITVETYGPGYEIVKEMNPQTPYQAKFSLAYCVSAAFLHGMVGLQQFDFDQPEGPGPKVSDIRAFLPNVRVVVADDLTKKYPAAWPTRVTVKLDNGKTLHGAADYPRGNPENPVGNDELEEKFMRLVAPRFGRDVTTLGVRLARSVEYREQMRRDFTAPLAHVLAKAAPPRVEIVEVHG